MGISDETRLFERQVTHTREVLEKVWQALEEKGYKPIDQIVGYLVSGDPSYITAYGEARSLIQSIERNDILEEMIAFYLADFF